MREEDLSIDELSYELSVMLEGMLYYAGVKKDKLQDAAETYIESIEEALDGSDAEGVDEVIEVIEYMKKKHSKFFK
ncbi:hypothetical protein [Campylobacter sp. RM16187]|uniref:hypothetical protein n=1 Tax=Campylobacter sp. RM16187 TaxID=1660063 RepID=UPI0021B6A92D|nr:hypothetical protein [Campylobacter sp. RM16187]QKG29068.1 hypothetical protein CDOMF_0797 [Campylobacter sp. RM16187]